jgi:signal transduction histidine kinase
MPFSELARSALEIVAGQLKSSSVDVQIEDIPDTVRGDRIRLIEVLQNLLDNACKYMGDQSEPLIEIGKRSEENGTTVFFIRDNGMGIEPQYHDTVFGLFNKLNPASEGTGIGLALTKRIIEIHKGRIWVESEGRGKGSTFCFTLASAE